ncbi:hypothetical protein HAX54_047030, partial [Datura stramonium]|nr:hypothetical protein [Datura stramonium]
GHKPSQRKQQRPLLYFPRFEKGGEGTESDGEDPPADDADERDSVAEENESIAEEQEIKRRTPTLLPPQMEGPKEG